MGISGQQILFSAGTIFGPSGNRVQRGIGLLAALMITAPCSRGTAGEPAAGLSEVAIQTGHSFQISALAFGPGGSILASAGGRTDQTVRLWDVAARKQFRIIKEEADVLAFTPDGRFVDCLAQSGRLAVRAVADGKLLSLGTPGFNQVLSGDGHTAIGNLLLARDGLNVLDVLTGNETKLAKQVLPLALSYSGRWLAARSGNQVAMIWDRLNEREARSFPFPNTSPFFAQLGGNESVLACVLRDKTLAVVNWGEVTNLFRHQIPSDPKALSVVRTTPAWVAVGYYGYQEPTGISIFDAKTGKLVRSLDLPAYAGGPICFSDDAKFLAVVLWRGGPVVTLWDPSSGLELAELRGPVSPISSVVQVPGRRLLITGSADAGVSFWDVEQGRMVRSLHLEHTGQRSLALSPDGQVLASAAGVNTGNGDYGSMGDIQRWPLSGGAALSAFKGQPGPLWCLAYSPDGTLLAGGGGETFSSLSTNQVCLWDAVTGQVKAHCAGHTGAVRALAFAPDGRALVTAGDDETVRVWNLPSGSLLKTLKCGIAQRSTIAVSADGAWVAAGAMNLYVWERKTGHLVLTTALREVVGVAGIEATNALFLGSASAVAFAPKGAVLAVGMEDGQIHFIDVAAKRVLFDYEGHAGSVESLAFNSDGNILASGSTDGSVRLWDMARRAYLASLIAVPPDDYVIVTPEGYYTATRNASRAVAFAVGARAYPFEQFDLRYNRPDKVLEALGGNPATIAGLRQAWQKRVRQLGLAPEELTADLELPQVMLASGPLPVSQAEETLSFTLQASDAHQRLARIQVYINDVPEFGMAGLDVRDRATNLIVQPLTVRLLSGRNQIQLAAVNKVGAESLKPTFEISCQAPVRRGDLYVVAIGVSDYADSKFHLGLAAKDALDLSGLFQGQANLFADVHCHVLTNQLATRANILATRDVLTRTRPEDQIVLFLAGHGMLDTNQDYFFATYDMDFAAPAKRGLRYDELEGLLDGVPARKKLVLLDTCQAGDVDKDKGPLAAASASRPAGGAASGQAPRAAIPEAEASTSLQSSLTLMQELFSDLRRGTGAHVIAATAGSAFAYERKDLGNGVFTYCVLEALRQKKADKNRDGHVSVTELREYVTERVPQLTEGRQIPTSRRENLEFDFLVF